MNCRFKNNNYCHDSFGDNNIAREQEALKHYLIAALEGHIEAQELYIRYCNMEWSKRCFY